MTEPQNNPRHDNKPRFLGPLEWSSFAAIVAGFFAADFLGLSTLGKIVTAVALLIIAITVGLLIYIKRRP